MTKECVINMIDCILGNDILCDCIEDSTIGCNECRRKAADIAINALKEQKTGHWIYKNNWYSNYECSECGCLNGYSKYCPNCGARMEREKE